MTEPTPQTSANPLAGILEMLFSQAQSRPDLQPMQTTPQAAAVGAVAGGMGQQPPAPTAPPVATFAGRVVTPGETPQQVLARPPLGEMEAGSTAMQAPAALGQAISSISLLSSIRNVAKGLKGKFPTVVVDKEGVPKVAYHSTPVSFEDFDVNKAQPGLWGLRGIWMSESPEIVSGQGQFPAQSGASKLTGDLGYATARSRGRMLTNIDDLRNYFRPGRVVQGYGGTDKVIAFNEPTAGRGWSVTVQEVDPATHEVKYGTRPRVHSTNPEIPIEHAPNTRPVFPMIQKPFDVDAHYSVSQLPPKIREEIQAFRKLRLATGGSDPISGNSVLDILRRGGADVTNKLKEAGYDGVTHVGGVRGGPPHRVWIAFDPKQVKSVFDPTLQELSGYVKSKAQVAVPSKSKLNSDFRQRFGQLDVQQRYNVLEEMGYDVDENTGRFFMEGRDKERYYLFGEQLDDAKREFLKLSDNIVKSK